MREILFRGKQVFFNDWIEGTGIFNDGINTWISFNEPEKAIAYGLNHKRVHPETIGQFTGLTDKNGKKIFEGDIIKIPDDYDEFGINAGEIYEVYFAFGGFRLKPKYFKGKGFWLEDDETVEIVGNIHDNPELLENPRFPLDFWEGM